MTMVEESRGEHEAHRRHREYRSSTEVLTRRGGIFWGIVLLFVGIVWLLGSLGYVDINLDIILPTLLIILAIWLIVSKITR